MSATLTVKGSVGFPGEDDPTTPVPAPTQVDLGLSLAYGQKADLELNYDSAVVDQAINLGTIGASPGAKFLLIKCVIGSCTIKKNDDVSGIPLTTPGDEILIGNKTQGWLTGLKVTTPGAAKIRLWIRG